MKAVCKYGWLCLFLFASTMGNSQGTWEKLPVPANRSFRSMCFTDSLYGWIAGDSGTIIHTADGGKTWTEQDSKTSDRIVTVFFLDRHLGWASSLNYTRPPTGTIILKTTDGGTHWTGIPYPVKNVFINCILFLDPENGWVGGDPHTLARTTNGGADWVQADIDTSAVSFFPVLSIKFYNQRYGYACGGLHDIAGVIWRTSDGGNKWFPIETSQTPPDEIYQVHIFDSLHVMGAGGDPDFTYGAGMILTSDGGLNWDYREPGLRGNAFDLAFRNEKEGWAPQGPDRKFLYTLDGGFTWTAISTPGLTTIYHVTFPDSLHGFAAGEDGAVLKYKSFSPGIDPGLTAPGDNYFLCQNYPNPFRSETKIKFSVPSDKGNYAILQIKIFSMQGTEVATVVNKEYSPGEYEVMVDAADLPAGIYYYRMTATTSQGHSISSLPKKMILIK
jgi:photosystem II stability/assembly factor-like uncharacterized protein